MEFNPKNPLTYALLLILFPLLLVNVSFFGKNLLQYGTIQPRSAQVIGEEQSANYYAIHQRNTQLKAEASQKTSMGFFEYLRQYSLRAFQGFMGITAHIAFPYSGSPYAKFILCFGIFFFGGWRLLVAHRSKRVPVPIEYQLLFLISLVYSSFVIGHHWTNYLVFKEISLALQSRYHFPVLPIWIGLLAFVTLQSTQKPKTRAVLGALIALNVFAFGFINAIGKLGPQWWVNG